MQWPKRERNPVKLGITIEVDVIVAQKIWMWTELARGEVSALGMVEELRDT